jgi:hypothetical protein
MLLAARPHHESRTTYHRERIAFSNVRCLRKIHVVDRVNHILRRDHATAEPATIEAFDGILAALHTVKLDVDLAIVIVETEADMHDVAILVLALSFDIVFELLLPACCGLPASC